MRIPYNNFLPDTIHMRAFFSALLLFGLLHPLVAQQENTSAYFTQYAHPQKSRFSTAMGVGFTAFDGSISRITDNDTQNNYLNLNASFDVGYQFTNYIGLLLRADYIRLNLSNEQLGQEVSSNNFQGAFLLKHYVFSRKQIDEYLRKFNYYALAGVGGLYINPKNRSTNEFFADNSEFDKFTPVFPLGAGLEYSLSNFFILGIELTYNITASDYLDGNARQQVGGNINNDRFALFTTRVNYRIPRKQYKYNDLLKLKDRKDKINKGEGNF